MKCQCGYHAKGNECFACGKVINEFKVKEKSKPAKVAPSRKDLDKEYLKLRKKFLEENKICAVFPELKATTVHHKKGRIGKLYLDTKYWLAVSMPGHEKIEHFPVWAKENNFSESRLK